MAVAGQVLRTDGLRGQPSGEWRVIGHCFTSLVANPRQLAVARRAATQLHRGLGEDVRRFREDAGVSRRQLSEAAGVDAAYLRRIELIWAELLPDRVRFVPHR
jgi:hypothetical protein